jgi:hypothetical protein
VCTGISLTTTTMRDCNVESVSLIGSVVPDLLRETL